METRGKRLADRALKTWPRLDADEEVIRAMELEELKAKAQRRSISQVQMSAAATSLFEALRTQLQVAFPNVIEAAEHKSISYHDPEFFLEVIPRKHGLVLVVDLDFNEVEADDGLAEDASDRSFVMYASTREAYLFTCETLRKLTVPWPSWPRLVR
jgi:predicted transport protein